MGVYASGYLIYGFLCNDGTEELFDAIQGENEEDLPFEELHEDLQEKYGISLYEVGGDAEIGVLAAFSTNVSGKRFDVAVIEPEALIKIEMYKANISAFLQDLGIDPTGYTPNWFLLAYMD